MGDSPWSNQVVSLIILTEQTAGFSGLFGYAGTPGANNLIISIAATAAAGIDPYGNKYFPGITTYFNNGGTYYAQQVNAAATDWFTASSEAGPWSFQGEMAIVAPAVGANYLALDLLGLLIADVTPNAPPPTPASGAIIYYAGGSLQAVGPSGNPVTIATT